MIKIMQAFGLFMCLGSGVMVGETVLGIGALAKMDSWLYAIFLFIMGIVLISLPESFWDE